MSDRKLLELAAKAAGIVIDKSATNGGGRGNTGFDMLGNAVLDWHNKIKWNPLEDDGDALRLAVTLGIIVGAYSKERFARVSWLQRPHDGDPKSVTSMLAEPINGDPLAATRRAIVRAAAAIGEKMP